MRELTDTAASSPGGTGSSDGAVEVIALAACQARAIHRTSARALRVRETHYTHEREHCKGLQFYVQAV